MALFGNLFGGGNQSVRSSRNVFRSYMGVSNGDLGYETMAKIIALVGLLGTYWRIWQYTVPAQTLVHWGYGSPALPDNQGYMWFSLHKAAAFRTGTLRIAQENYSGHTSLVVAEIPDSALHLNDPTTLTTSTPTDRNTMVPLPEKVEFPWVGQDSRITLFYNPSMATGTETMVGFQIPITVQQ